MTDLQAKRKTLKALKEARWKSSVENYTQYIILFIDPTGDLTSTPCPRHCSLRQARRKLQNYPTGKLFKHVYVPV